MFKLLFSIFIIFSINVYSQKFTELTDENFESFAKTKEALFLVFTTNCDMGKNFVDTLEKSVKDIKGVEFAYMYYNNANEILGKFPSGDLGSIYFVNYGEPKEIGKPWGSNEIKKWIYETLTKHKIKTTIEKPEETRVSPEIIKGDADLEKGLIAFYQFEGNKKDTAKLNEDIVFNKDSISIKENTMEGTGKYTYDSGAYIPLSKDIFNKSFSLAFNFKITKSEEGRGENHNILFCLRDRTVEFSIRDKKLEISFNFYPLYGDWFFKLDEININFDEWNNLIISLNEKNDKLFITLNGERLKDIYFDKTMQKQFAEFMKQKSFKSGEYSWSISENINFFNYGYGGVFSGNIDDFMIYDKVLNNKETEEIFNKYSKNSKTKKIQKEIDIKPMENK